MEGNKKMSDTNVVIILGRLTRDGELKYLPTGTALLTGSIANNQGFKKDGVWQDTVHFFDFKLWSKRAESLAQYLLKGTQIVIEGQLKQERWQNDAGQARSKVIINVNNLSFAGGKKTGNGQQAQGQLQDQKPQEQAPPPAQTPPGPPPVDDFVDDIPF